MRSVTAKRIKPPAPCSTSACVGIFHFKHSISSALMDGAESDAEHKDGAGSSAEPKAVWTVASGPPHPAASGSITEARLRKAQMPATCASARAKLRRSSQHSGRVVWLLESQGRH